VRSTAGFALAAGLLTLIPGPDTLLTVRTAIAAGRAQALAAVLGICLILLGWGLTAGLGLAAALAAAPRLYLALRYAGAAYLGYLGLHALIRGARWPATDAPPASGDLAPSGAPSASGAPLASGAPSALGSARLWASSLRGALTCASNPKVGLFYLAIFPQFIAPGSAPVPASLMLAGIHAAETMAWLTVVAAMARRLGRLLRRRAVRRWADRLSGATFLAFAARLAAGG
jgi:threonine/homoserine/homoserine lactone efflux protein